MTSKKNSKNNQKKTPMRNITINIPEIYEDNIQELIQKDIIASRSEGIRIAIREYLNREYDNLKLLGFFENIENNQEQP